MLHEDESLAQGGGIPPQHGHVEHNHNHGGPSQPHNHESNQSVQYSAPEQMTPRPPAPHPPSAAGGPAPPVFETPTPLMTPSPGYLPPPSLHTKPSLGQVPSGNSHIHAPGPPAPASTPVPPTSQPPPQVGQRHAHKAPQGSPAEPATPPPAMHHYAGHMLPSGDDKKAWVESNKGGWARLQENLFQYWRVISSDRDSKRLFIFISINGLFMVMEFLYGFLSNSLGMISDAFHMGFDCFALVISLAAIILSKRKPSFAYSYGYERFEVLSGFTNAIFLILVSLFLFLEALGRIVSPPEIDSEQLLPVAVIGLIVNLIGIFFFHGHAHGGGDCQHAHDENLHAVFLHILADTVSSVGVIVSTWLVKWKGWLIADPLVSILISWLILTSVMPLFKSSGEVLLQVTPPRIKNSLDKCLREASTFDGVLEVRSWHFWTQAPGVYVGTLFVRVRSDANEQSVLARVNNIFAGDLTYLTVQIEKDDWLLPETPTNMQSFHAPPTFS